MVLPKVEGSEDNAGSGSNENPLQALPQESEGRNKRKSEIPLDVPKRYALVEEKLKSMGITSNTEERSQEADWDDSITGELEALLINNLNGAFQSGIKKIVERGHNEELAEWAVLSSGTYLGYKDMVSNIVDGALALLARKKSVDASTRPLFDSLERLVAYAMLEMLSVLKEIKPSLTIADAMWRLLICDMNLSQALAIEGHTPNQLCNHESSLKCTCNGSASLPDGTTPVVTKTNLHVGETSSASPKVSSANSRRSILRQKIHAAKSNRGQMGKAALKARVTSMTPNSLLDPCGVKKNINSSKVTKITATVEATCSHNPAAEKQEIKQTLNIPSSSALPDNDTDIPYGAFLGNVVPPTEKDQLIAILNLKKQQLQKEMQGWITWTTDKVSQAAQRLSKDKAELKMLRQEREEGDKFQKENTMKRFTEMERALYDADVQLKMANASLHNHEAQHALMKKGMETAKMIATHSSTYLKEAKRSEQEVLNKCQTLEAERGFLQQEFTALKGKGANLQQQLEKARRRQDQLEALWKHEEKEKKKFLEQAESLERERKQSLGLTRIAEANMRAKAESGMQKIKEHINMLSAEISSLRLDSEASKMEALQRGSGSSSHSKTAMGEHSGVKRERECAMCLTEEISVVFLPCAHQVLCKECNDVHEKKGMKDCPSCRAPIVHRINCIFSHSRAP